MFKITIITLYPEIFSVPLDYSILRKANQKNLWSLQLINIRDFAPDKHKTVDDKIFGGGRGMLLKPDVLSNAIEAAFNQGASRNLILLTPAGKTFKQEMAQKFIKGDGITIICGHFKGIDYRILEKYKPIEVSIGDFVLSGGEFAALTIVDACVRLLPGAMNAEESMKDESFTAGLLEHPNYTHPYDFEGRVVPPVLLSGNHKKIAEWRQSCAEVLTKQKRPDLWQEYIKSKENKND